MKNRIRDYEKTLRVYEIFNSQNLTTGKFLIRASTISLSQSDISI